MFATTHVVTAIVLSQRIHNLPALFDFSFLSHIILDIIPHGDMKNKKIGKRQEQEKIKIFSWQYIKNFSKNNKKFIAYSLTDVTILSIIIYYLIHLKILDVKITLTAILGGLAIDLISILYKLTRWKFLLNVFERWHQNLHRVFTKYLPKGDISPLLSIFLQISFVIITVRILLM